MAWIEDLPSGGKRVAWREYPGGPKVSETFPKGHARAANNFRIEIEHKLLVGDYVDPTAGDILFGAYCDQFTALQLWRPRTVQTRKTAMRRARAEWEDRPLSSIRTSDARAWVAKLSADLKPSVVGVYVSAVSAVFGQAVTDGLLARNPFAGVKRPKRPKVPVTPLTVDTVAAFREHADDDFRLAIDLGARAGLRMSEARGLTLDRVEFLRRRIRIDRQASHSDAGWVPPKSANSDRVVPVTGALLEAVNRHVDEHGVNDDGLLFSTTADRMLTYGQWHTKWRKAVDRSEVNVAARYHDLRHHFASEQLGHGVSVVAVAAALGDDPATVLATYAHLTNSDDDRIRAVDELLWSTGEAPSVAEVQS